MSRYSSQRSALTAAGVLGLAGVGLGALGAHALQTMLAAKGMVHVWDTAAKYNLYHAVALLAAAAFLRNSSRRQERWLRWTVWLWTAGVILFSGSLYWFSAGGPFALVYVTPIGGLCLLAGWAFVIVAAAMPDSGC